MAGPRYTHDIHGSHEDIFTSRDIKVVVDHDEGTVVVAYKDVELSLTCIGDIAGEYWNGDESDMSGSYGDAYQSVKPGQYMIGTWMRGGDFFRLLHNEVEDAR